MKDATTIFTRNPANPLLKVQDFPGIAQLYNPSPVQFGDETLLLVSVTTHKTDEQGMDVGQTRIARSKDGINFELSEDNFIKVDKTRKPYCYMKHFIDNRVTKIGDTYWIITPVMMNEGWDAPVGLLGKTKDFINYEPVSVITQPRNRGASLFPEKINGKYYKIDRPNGIKGYGGDLWLSSSPDLVHWGDFQPLQKAGYRFWNMDKIGPTPPIKTEKGWLEIIHGVFTAAGGTTYYLGAMLLDLEDPSKIIGKTGSYILAPETPYEQHGNCHNTIFACGAIADYDKDQVRIYYGAADMAIALATGSLSELLDACIEEI